MDGKNVIDKNGKELIRWIRAGNQMMVPVVKSAMRVIVGLESDEQNEYAFQASFWELNE